MVTCCFLGQSQVYDKDIEKRLNKAVAEIAQANTSVRFLFCGLDADNKASYFDYAFTAVYLAEQANPQKKIFQSIVVEKEKRGSFIAGLCNWRAEVPSFMVDEVLSPPWVQEEHTRSAYEQRIRNWVIERSDYLISYQYDCLCDYRYMADKNLLTAEKSIIDITAPTTRDAIHEKYALLPSQTQAAMELMLEGKTVPEIADALGIIENEAEKLLSQGTRTVQEAMAEDEIHPKKGRCAVFALGPECYENLCLFHTTVRYLMLHKNVRTYYVYEAYLNSTYQYVLEQALQMCENDGEIIYLNTDLNPVEPPTVPYAEKKIEEMAGAFVYRCVNAFPQGMKLINMFPEYCICNLSFPDSEGIKDTIKGFANLESRNILFCDLAEIFAGDKPWRHTLDKSSKPSSF